MNAVPQSGPVAEFARKTEAEYTRLAIALEEQRDTIRILTAENARLQAELSAAKGERDE